jgi:hypothetical protein
VVLSTTFECWGELEYKISVDDVWSFVETVHHEDDSGDNRRSVQIVMEESVLSGIGEEHRSTYK